MVPKGGGGGGLILYDILRAKSLHPLMRYNKQVVTYMSSHLDYKNPACMCTHNLQA